LSPARASTFPVTESLISIRNVSSPCATTSRSRPLTSSVAPPLVIFISMTCARTFMTPGPGSSTIS